MTPQNSILQKIQMPPFLPLPLFSGAWRQTVLGAYFPQKPNLKSNHHHIVELQDKERLLLVENCPAQWSPGGRIAVLTHGLSGCSNSSYMIRMARRFTEANYLVYRINLRGCGPGLKLAATPYHGGRSKDLLEVLQWIQIRHPNSPITMAGFSLGANITLKTIGENNDNERTRQTLSAVDSAIAVSPPIQLSSYVTHIQKNFRHRFFDKYFVHRLKQDIQKLAQHHPQISVPEFPKELTLNLIDEYYTAPRSGFQSADHYYETASSFPHLGKISVPTLILYAKDDPIIAPEDFEHLPNNPFLNLVTTEKGGHVGFVGFTPKDKHSPCNNRLGHFRWMDELLLKWVKSI